MTVNGLADRRNDGRGEGRGPTSDDKDALLLAALRDNARETLVALARRVGLSRSATQDRLRRLERSGVIEGYTVRTRSVGAPPVAALLLVTFAPGGSCAAVVPHLRRMPEIVACDALAGPFDLALRAVCSSVAALEAARARVAATPGVASVSTHVVLAARWSEETRAGQVGIEMSRDGPARQP